MGNPLSGQQLAIMKVLWERGEATVADVQESLNLERPLAYSTVATVMSRMERKKLLTHRAQGRIFRYRPLVSAEGIERLLVGDLVDRVFGGSPAQLVNHLLETDQVDASELDRIKESFQTGPVAPATTSQATIPPSNESS